MFSVSQGTMRRRRAFLPMVLRRRPLESETIIWAQDLEGTGCYRETRYCLEEPTLTGMVPQTVSEKAKFSDARSFDHGPTVALARVVGSPMG